MTIDVEEIWIVERVRCVEHDGSSQHVVGWHASSGDAHAAAGQLQAAFDLACEIARPRHAVVDTIFDMYQEEVCSKEHTWVDCDDDECGYFEKHHQHHAVVVPCEADQALIAQLQDWWHQESREWRIFVEDEIFSRMADPPRSATELVADDADVRYEVRQVLRGGVSACDRLAAWAHDESVSSQGEVA